MSAAEQIARTITEPLTWAQICSQYPDQWVCVVEIEWDEPRKYNFRSARVVGSGKTRREPFVQARPWWDRYSSIGHYFTGRVRAPLRRPFV